LVPAVSEPVAIRFFQKHLGGRFWRPPSVLPVTLPAYFFFAVFLAAFFAGFFATAFLVAIVFYSPFVVSTSNLQEILCS
jgi:hypothetical protein